MPLTTTSTAGVAHKRGVPFVAPSSAPASGQDFGAPSNRHTSRSPVDRERGRKAASPSPSRSSSGGRRAARQGRSQVRGRRPASGPSGDHKAGHPDRHPSPGRFRSRTPGRVGAPQGGRRMKECWYGRYCTRLDCWFAHPDGRMLDERMQKERRRHERESQRERKQRYRSPSPVRASSSSRSASRSASPPKRSPARSQSSSPSRKSSRSASARSRSPRSSSKTSVRKAEESDGAAEHKDSAPGATSFVEFVICELDDEATPETALAKFEEHKQGLLKKRMESLKGTGVFFDLYNPVSLLRRFDLRTRSAQRAAEAFLQELRQGRFEGLSLRAATSGSPTCATTGHMQPPHFAFDPDVDALLVEGVPPAATVWALYDACAAAPGLAAAAWPKPASADAPRELRARFASAAAAGAAVAALEEASTEAGQKPQVRLLEPTPDLRALVVPPEMSHPARLEKDVELSEQAVRRLDALMGVPSEVTEALLEHQGSTVTKLDCQVLYLRRVHQFCFYAASWCDDEWDLRKRCGAALVRDGGADAPAEEGDWAKAHEERLRSFLAAAEFSRPTALDECNKRLVELADTLCQEKTQQATEGKFKCLACGKYFKGPDYVHKHLRKAHGELFESLQKEAHLEAAAAAFLAAPIPSSSGGR